MSICTFTVRTGREKARRIGAVPAPYHGLSVHGPDRSRPMASWPDFAIREQLVRYAGPALEAARDEARARGWEA